MLLTYPSSANDHTFMTSHMTSPAVYC